MENELGVKETNEENEVARPGLAERPALRLPLALTLVSLVIWFSFQTVALMLERDQLKTVSSNFEAGTREAEKMRAQLETLVSKTTELASKGNRSARAAVEELAKKGIPLGSATAPPK